MRLTPKSVFLGIVVLGLPVAVLAGWSLSSPATPPPVVAEAPGGAGGLGAAPAGKEPARTTEETRTWSPRAPRPVSVIESVAPSAGAVAPAEPTTAAPEPSASPSETSTLTLPPVPTPTSVETTPPDPEPSMEEPPFASEAPPSGLGPLRWGRRH